MKSYIRNGKINFMRLDLLLKQTGLIKRRTIAKELVDLGKVLINDKTAKPSSEVKENDILTLKLGNRVLKVRINYVQQGRRIVPAAEQLSMDKNEAN